MFLWSWLIGWSAFALPLATASLRGWLDDGPTVVPWVDGRPLWPRHRYETVNLNDRRDRGYFAALVGGAVSEA